MTADGATLRGELRAITKLAYPITLTQLGLMSLALVDTAIIGKSSVEDLAGAALGRSILFLTTAAGMGIPLSLETLATQAIGAREPEVARAALSGALRASAIVTLPIVAVAIAIALTLPSFGVEPAVARRALDFVLGNAPGTYGFLLFLGAKTFLQAHGRTAPALVAALFANVLNYGVCNVLVHGDDALAAIGFPRFGLPKLGALGAGLSVSISQFVLGGITLYAVNALIPRARNRAPLPVARIVRFGIPIGLQMLAEVGVFSVVAMVAGGLGAEVIAAHQIAISLASTTFMVALGISGAAAVRVGATVGAGHSPRRIGYLATGLAVAIMGLGALAFWFVPGLLIAPFTNDPTVRSIAVQLLAIAAMFQLFDATQGTLAGALRGAGDVRWPFVMMLIGYWAVGFPLALLLAFSLDWGAHGLWWGLSAGLCFVALALLARFSHVTSRPITRV